MRACKSTQFKITNCINKNAMQNPNRIPILIRIRFIKNMLLILYYIKNNFGYI